MPRAVAALRLGAVENAVAPAIGWAVEWAVEWKARLPRVSALVALCVTSAAVQATSPTSVAVEASVPEYPQANISFRPVGVTQGLEARTVSSIDVDSQGFLWVASREGVYRYDGISALRFERDAGDPDAITDVDIRAVHADPHGRLWVSTNTGGLNLYLPGRGFRHWRSQPGQPASLSYDSVYGVAMTADGALWVGTQKGLNRLNPETGEIRRIALPGAAGVGQAPYIFPLRVDPGGTLWVGTVGAGLYRRRPGQDRFEHIDLASALDDPRVNDVFAIHWMEGHGLFVGTRGGVVRVRGDSVTGIPLRDPPGSPDTVTALASDDAGRLLIATMENGLLELNLDDGVVRQAPIGDARGALPDRAPISLKVHQGQIFVGTLGAGVFAGRRLKAGYDHIVEGLRNTNVTAIVPGERTGEVFVGTFGGGVQRLHGPTGRVTELVPDPESPAQSIGVVSLARSDSGMLYAGAMAGLWRIDPATGATRSFTAGAHGLGEGYVTALLPGPHGEVLIGTGGSGVFRLVEASERIEPVSSGGLLPDREGADYIKAFLAEGPDALWVGTRSSGLFLCDRNPWACRQVASEQALGHQNVTALFRDRDGVVWTASDGGGMYKVLPSNDGGYRLEQPAGSRGILGDDLMGLVADDDGSLWLTSRGGLTRLDPATGDTMGLDFPLPDGGDVFNAGSVARDAKYVYFGSLNGVLLARCGTEFDPAPVRPLRFTRITIPGQGAEQRLDAIQVDREYRLAPGATVLAEFALLDYLDQAHRYQYRLEGSDGWRDIGRSSVLTLSGLSPGLHQLWVRGRMENSRWSVSDPISFRVVPPFWRTSMFQAGIAVALLFLAWISHRRRIRAVTRHNARLVDLNQQREQALRKLKASRGEVETAISGLRNLAARLEQVREEERKAISRELHDELGQVLTAAKLGLQMHKTRFSVRSLARASIDRTIGLLDDAIVRVRSVSRSLRPPLLEQTGLMPALRDLLASLSETTGVPIKIRMEGDPYLPVEQKIGVFRIVQEAVNNALKHARPRRIDVTLQARGTTFRAEIRDDGAGFDGKEARRLAIRGDRLGLLGMSERARALEGSLEVESEPGKGCCVRLTIPVETMDQDEADEVER